MAEEITSTLRERAATVKEILAEMAQDAAKEREREATWQRLAEAKSESPEVGIDWHSDIFAIDPELYLPLPEEMTGVVTSKVAAEGATGTCTGE